MNSMFTERDTEEYYDSEDAIYRSIWDEGGSVHWGIFDQETGGDFLKACSNLNSIMARKAGIDADARVLDVGCGNGNTAIWLGKNCGCRVFGVDLSGVRIGNARDAMAQQPDTIKALLGFEKASATDLPFEMGSFTRVWSQAAIYHVHDKVKALQEVYRVMGKGGLFVFDDLFKPKEDISPSAKKYVYDRLLFDTPFNFDSYQDALRSTGFTILNAEDISSHLRTSYDHLARISRSKSSEDNDRFGQLSIAYEQTVKAVDNNEIGWGMYLCQK